MPSEPTRPARTVLLATILAAALAAGTGCGGTADESPTTAAIRTAATVNPPGIGATNPCIPPAPVPWDPPRAGDLDSSFGCRGVTILALDDDRVTLTALVVLPDDRIVAVGSRYNQPTNNNDGWIARFDAAGRLDPTFGQGGVVTSNIELGGGEGFNDVALLADGSFVAAGYIVPEDLDPSPQAILRRFDAHGKADAAFTNVSSGPPVVMVGGMREATGIVAPVNTNTSASAGDKATRAYSSQNAITSLLDSLHPANRQKTRQPHMSKVLETLLIAERAEAAQR